MAPETFASAGKKHEEFTQWAKDQGIQINGVAAVRFPGRGIGIAALRGIDAGETIVSVPTSSLLTLDKIPSTFREKFQGDTPVQGIFAAYLACDDDARSRYAPWRATWPTMRDFEDSIPLLWPKYLIGTPGDELKGQGETTGRGQEVFPSLLPPSISGHFNLSNRVGRFSGDYTPDHQNLLENQRSRFRKAFSRVKLACPGINLEIFTYYWFATHTRCFFYVAKDSEVPEDRNDAMALCPFADYFNHSSNDPGCKASFDGDGYTFTATKSYAKGEEVFVCYGNHTSDVLLTDYGFVPDENKWDAIFLDDIVLQDINKIKRRYLKEDNYLGNYQVTRAGPCFRTEVAASLTYMSVDDWSLYVGGTIPSSFDSEKTDRIVASWIRKYRDEADLAIARVEGMVRSGIYETANRLKSIILRWKQIRELCSVALDSLEPST
ncbi:uncharacterized protein CIMG_00433 [Coccidioides immitis RS]|uniref:SET domain-containing protein n=3 Tax=Coccidioides immitis TaxID=5501 RepID=A0A0D8JSJ3_COCIM|nr:uncharacterized protein CIMG_00433 [Coccidioides immitis RS]KJF60315.1 hypothetical protein CIMG_00433 [Coccidioides immitis RS]KMP00295.1 hypothetical protein CIRG_00437 [Coccidioides immitis RMSCC 2394]KMU80646.1 hypothetical protein CISG_08635 [Coccidioides immitis RMSCC 3703]TPX26635.1 hypothetical protein DIZ76_012097 [Coccidioides immitis]